MSAQGIQSDISKQLQDTVKQAIENKTPLNIRGGGTKSFYGRSVSGDSLEVAGNKGILSYEPTELVITARAGTPLNVIEQILADNNQMLPFEPPGYGDSATLGGTIACNFSGPRRAYSGAARDFVLGTKILNGKSEIVSFGGEVMKNVAGYDVSRLMAGAMGTLGVILEASIKVIPTPESEITLTQNLSIDNALKKCHQWSALPLPISASCFYGDTLYIRLSGSGKALAKTKKAIGGDDLTNADSFWCSVKEQTHEFFSDDRPLWRLSLASNTALLSIDGNALYEWGGALRWLKTDEPAEKIRALSETLNSHTTLFRTQDERDDVFQPLPEHLLKLHRRLKQAFDPAGIFNIGRMYRDF